MSFKIKNMEVELERRKKIGNSLRGRKVIILEETKNKIRETVKKLWETEDYRKKQNNLDYLHTTEIRNKIDKISIGKKISNSLKGRHLSEEHKKSLRENAKINPNYGMKGKHQSEKSRLKMIGNSYGFKKGVKLTPEQLRKCLAPKPKSSLEIKFENIINKLNLPYKFVGNGQIIIARKCPDFINTNGEKIAIEVYCRKHKEMFRGVSIDDWKIDRIKIFKENGWELLFFDETQVNEENVKNILGIENYN